VLVLGQVLVAEEDHLVLDEGAPNLGEGRVHWLKMWIWW
jgi:hypothetical protein